MSIREALRKAGPLARFVDVPLDCDELALALVVSAFYYPLWAGIQLDYWAIAAHWWLPTWR